MIESWRRGVEKITFECMKYVLPIREIQYDTSFMLSLDTKTPLKKLVTENDLKSDRLNVGGISGLIMDQVIENKGVSIS